MIIFYKSEKEIKNYKEEKKVVIHKTSNNFRVNARIKPHEEHH